MVLQGFACALCFICFSVSFATSSKFNERGLKPDTVTAFEITSALVQPLVDTINSGLSTLVPIGIGIMGTFIGIHLIRRVIYTFL